VPLVANLDHLAKLRLSVDVWNGWRKENPHIKAELTDADLSRAVLTGANLSMANLSGANLSRAVLIRANLNSANMTGANLTEADLGYTVFGDINLGRTKGLESCNHFAPNIIDHQTLTKSGNLPLSFLRGCGLPDILIDYLPSLLNQPIQFYSCFISYATKDQQFAERLHADLQNKGVRCWFAPEDLKIGDKFRSRIDESIRVYDKLMLLLSENSIQSPWVEEEVEAALEKEHQQNKLVLFPIRLDDAVMQTQQAWAASLRRIRHVGDFRNWKDHDAYQRAFDRLLRDLKSEKP